MNPVVRVIGKMLRMVGISSPEDTVSKPKAAFDPPSWRDQPVSKPADLSSCPSALQGNNSENLSKDCIY